MVLPNQAVWPSKSPIFEGSVLKTSGLLMALRSRAAYAPGALFSACSPLTAVAPMTVPASSASSSSAIGRFMAFSFELFVNFTSPHATKVAYAADLRCVA